MNIYEQRIIGGLLGGHAHIADLSLLPEDFTDPALREVYTVIKGLEESKQVVSTDTVLDGMADSMHFVGRSDLETYAKNVRGSQPVFDASDRLRDESCRQYLVDQAYLLSQSNGGASDLLTGFKSAIQTAEKQWASKKNSFQSIADLLGVTRQRINDAYEGIADAIPTGFPKWDDEILDGYSKKDLHIVAGFTGGGKSSLILNTAEYQAKMGIGVGYVNREMSEVESMIRLIDSSGEIPRWWLRKGITEERRDAYLAELDRLKDLPIYFDTEITDIETLRTVVKPLVEAGVIEILYVDYLQLMKTNKKGDKRADDVAAVSRGLKEIAMENNIPVVAACQFNRSGTDASLFDLLYKLKESSGIEQDSTTVTYIQTEKTEKPEKYVDARLIVLKNRNGACHTPINMTFRGECFKFEEAKEGYDWRRDAE